MSEPERPQRTAEDEAYEMGREIVAAVFATRSWRLRVARVLRWGDSVGLLVCVIAVWAGARGWWVAAFWWFLFDLVVWSLLRPRGGRPESGSEPG